MKYAVFIVLFISKISMAETQKINEFEYNNENSEITNSELQKRLFANFIVGVDLNASLYYGFDAYYNLYEGGRHIIKAPYIKYARGFEGKIYDIGYLQGRYFGEYHDDNFNYFLTISHLDYEYSGLNNQELENGSYLGPKIGVMYNCGTIDVSYYTRSNFNFDNGYFSFNVSLKLTPICMELGIIEILKGS